MPTVKQHSCEKQFFATNLAIFTFMVKKGWYFYPAAWSRAHSYPSGDLLKAPILRPGHTPIRPSRAHSYPLLSGGGLQLLFWAKGSDFGRSSCHFEQRVSDFGRSSCHFEQRVRTFVPQECSLSSLVFVSPHYIWLLRHPNPWSH